MKVTVVGKDGTEHSATRVIVYTTEVSVESVALADKSVAKDGTVKLIPTFTPATATNKNVTWTSSKPEVATIAADGTVTGVVEGETTITVTTEDGGFTATCKVKVTAGPTFENEGEAGIDGSSWDKAYTIKNKEQLVLLATRVNGNQSSTWNNKYYKLLGNIDLETMEWTPIGSSSLNKSFYGNFDGAGYSISGALTIKDTERNAGIFGAGRGVTIQNLSFKGSISEHKNADGRLGSIIGQATQSRIVNCHNTASLVGYYVGGITGASSGSTITACSNSGTISGKGVGGIISDGNGSSTIGCLNTADIKGLDASAGGIIGVGSVTACWSTANTITSTSNRKGGIVGWAYPDKTEYCYWKTIAGINKAAGSGTAENCAAFSGDTPSEVQIKAMNDAWQAADATREYQFNATTGMIEKKP